MPNNITVTTPPPIVVQAKGGKSTVIVSPTGSATRLVELADVDATTLNTGDTLVYSNITGEWDTVSGNSFGTVNVAGQNDVVATVISDTLVLRSGTGILITTDSTNGVVDIAATGGSAFDGTARDIANAAFEQANSAALRANTLVTDNVPETTSNLYFTGARVRANISNTTPVNYDPSTGIISHADSAASPTTYGNTTFVPVITLDAKGHIIAVTNTAIAGTSGTDQFARDQANAAFTQANTANTVASSAYAQANIATTNADAAFLKANGAIYTAAQIRANLSNTAPINYDPSTGIISHADSGASATTYGNTTFVPTITVDAKGHVTSVSNTAINFPPSGVTSVAGKTGAVLLDTYDIAENLASNLWFTAARVRANVSNTTPINYDPSTGTFSHALSGVAATGHGDGATVPKIVVDDKGHVTSVTNTAIAISATAITSGTLAVTRGGTGQTAITVNGSLLIGNTVSGGFDVNPLTQGTGILITNDRGAITIAATGGAAGNSFGVISVSGQSDVVADQSNDTFTLVQGTGIVITTDASTDTITIAATGGSATDQYARDHANGAFDKANTANVTGQAAFDKANGAIYTAAQIRTNLSNTAPINYDATTGIISHALSGVSATGYGDSATVPKIVVDDKGHTTSITNTAIAISAAAITSGTLSVARGGTGQTAITVNGSLLIGNTVSGGFDVNPLTQGTNITITNDKGAITIASSDAFAQAQANAAYDRANAAYANANTAIYTATQIRANISNTAPVNYDAATGVISHALSGVTATTYGNTTFVPTITVDDKGHVTAIVNTAIALPPSTDEFARAHANAAFDRANTANTVAASAYVQANIATTNADAAFARANAAYANANTAIYTATQIRANISNTAPINYDAATGIVSHADSGVVATGHGDSATIPKMIVDAKGHITSVTNTAIAIAASQITSGTLSVARGGTGQTAITVNGSLLIGNTVSGGFDVNPLTQGSGILITNDKGSITIAATGGSATDQYARDKANGAAQNAFVTINVAGQSDIVADSNTDTLTLVAGNGMILTTNSITDTITISANLSLLGEQVGAIEYHAGVSAHINYLQANGAIVSRTTYSELFSEIGEAYGSGDGTTTFVLPDLHPTFPAWVVSNTYPELIERHTVNVLPDNRILVIGGLNSGVGSTTANAFFGNVSGNNVIWTAASNTLPAARSLHTSHILADGRVLVVGGRDSGGGLVSTTYFGNISGTTIVWTSGTALNVATSEHSSSMLPDGRIVVSGGSTTATNTEFGNISGTTITWTAGTVLPLERKNHVQLTDTHGRLVLVGGRDIAGTVGNQVYFGDVVGTAITWTPGTPIPQTRANHSAVMFLMNKIFLAGGVTTSTTIIPYIGIVDGGTNITWKVDQQIPTLTGFRTYTGIGVLANNDLVLVGGFDGISVSQNVVFLGSPLLPMIRTNAIAQIVIGTTTAEDQFARDQANAAFNRANIATTNADAAFTQANAAYANANTAIYTATQIRANISNAYPVYYNATTGVISFVPATANGETLIGNTVSGTFDVALIAQTAPVIVTNGKGTVTLSHASSGVVETGYGTPTQIPVFVVDAFGHITSVTNTAISGLDVGVITSGLLSVARGGTGKDATGLANGQLLIGNTVNTGFDLTTIAQTAPVIVTNGKGTITLSHASSGVTATGYGTAALVPVFVVDAFGHITSVTNTSIAIAASAITSGTLVVARGGTGQSSYTNGQILIGNTGSTGLDVGVIAQSAPVIVTVAQGSITISHARSGVTATGYGDAASIPVFVVDANGHITSVTNTTVAIAASAVTSGILSVARGGTGKDATGLVNGQILIANTVNTGFDLAGVTQTAPIIVSTDKGSIRVSHARSGVTATTYGSASLIPVLTIDDNGHITTATTAAASGLPTATANGQTLIGNTVSGSFDAALIAQTAPIIVTNGKGTITLSHASSGVTATGYGDAASIPVFVVDAFGHITGVTNTAVAISAAAITSGTLVQGRGGTGFTGASANGQTLIGNTVSGGFDLATLTAGTGITINNLKGSIEIVATGGSATDQYARDKANGAVQTGFTIIAVAGQSDVVPESNTDTLTLVGSGITITTDAGTDTITFTSAGGGGNGFGIIQVTSGGVAQANVYAEGANTPLKLIGGNNITLTSDDSANSVTISAPIAGLSYAISVGYAVLY